MRDFSCDFVIHSKEELACAVEEWGILPFFVNSVSGFSVEEHIDRRLWFTSAERPWEWKGPLIREYGFAYGKFFEKKAAFVSPEWFRELANYRRDGYDFDALCDEGLANTRDARLYNLLSENAPVLSKRLKRLGDYGRDGIKGFETSITRLQSQCYILISDFVYMRDRYGEQYGWGVAEYSTPEKFFGGDFAENVYSHTPEESRDLLLEHVKKLFPDESEKRLLKFLGINSNQSGISH